MMNVLRILCRINVLYIPTVLYDVASLCYSHVLFDFYADLVFVIVV